MDNFTSKIKQRRALGMSLFRFFSIVFILFGVIEAGIRTDTVFVNGGIDAIRIHSDSADMLILRCDTVTGDSIYTSAGKFVRVRVDSIFNLTGTAGYVQCLSSTKKTINSPIFTDYTNIAIGKSSVEAWDGTQRAVQFGGTNAIMFTASEGLASVYYLQNAYYDGVWKPYVSGIATTYRMSTVSGEHIWYSDTGLTADVAYTPTIRMRLYPNGNLKSTGACTTSTLNTGKITSTDTVTGTKFNSGLGATELYAMDQNVRTTDDVTHDSITATDLKITDDATINDDLTVSGGITIAGGSQLTVYKTGSFPCTTKTTDLTVQVISTINYTVIGSVAFLELPTFSGVSNSTTLRLYCNIPFLFGSTPANSNVFIGLDNNALVNCYAAYSNDNIIYIKKTDDSNFTASSNKGIARGTTITLYGAYY